MPSLARCIQSSLLLLVVVLVLLITGCDTPGDNSTTPLQAATPAVEVPPPYAPAPTPTFPTMNTVVSQTVEGVTISIVPVHADAHRMVLALRIQGPARPYDRAFDLAWITPGKDYMPSLSANGKDLPLVQGHGVLISPAGEPSDGQSVLAFDASGLETGADTIERVQSLSLQLSLPVYENNHPDEYRPWPPGPVVTRAIEANEVPTQVPPPPASRLLSFEFSFQVPFDSERIVLRPHQTVEQNGLQVTLRQLDITASEALVTLHYVVLNREVFDRQRGPGVSAVLTVPSESSGEDITIVSEPEAVEFGADAEGEMVFSYSEPSLLRKTSVDCTLSVSAGSTSASRVDGSGSPPLGEWIFPVMVPATSSP